MNRLPIETEEEHTCLHQDGVALLRRLIAIPSYSGEEAATAEVIESFLRVRRQQVQRCGNNVIARSAHFDETLPTVLLASHHDTVRPCAGWVREPFRPAEEAGRLYGLGSNDAGGALCAMIMACLYWNSRHTRPYNVVLLACAEEESAGPGGISMALAHLPPVACALVGEPTGMQMAVAEKGLMVLDCVAEGRAGHAARDIGENAIGKAIEAISWIHTYRFPRVSPDLGPVKMTVTQIEAGKQHNVIPDRCRFVVDVRVTDAYTHEEILDTLRANLDCRITARSTRLRASAIAMDHPLVRTAQALAIPTFASPTLSDQAQLPLPSVKIGPGMSERSHTADEYIGLREFHEGIDTYCRILEALGEWAHRL